MKMNDQGSREGDDTQVTAPGHLAYRVAFARGILALMLGRCDGRST